MIVRLILSPCCEPEKPIFKLQLNLQPTQPFMENVVKINFKSPVKSTIDTTQYCLSINGELLKMKAAVEKDITFVQKKPQGRVPRCLIAPENYEKSNSGPEYKNEYGVIMRALMTHKKCITLIHACSPHAKKDEVKNEIKEERLHIIKELKYSNKSLKDAILTDKNHQDFKTFVTWWLNEKEGVKHFKKIFVNELIDI